MPQNAQQKAVEELCCKIEGGLYLMAVPLVQSGAFIVSGFYIALFYFL